MTCLKHNWKIN